MEPCRCSESDLQKIFDQFKGSDPPFLPSDVDGKTQTITLSNEIAVSQACRLADGTSMCGRPLFKVTNSETFEDISKWRHKGVTWDAITN